MERTEIPTIHIMLFPGLAGSINCTPVRTLGDTMERLARPAIPARHPHTKPVIKEASSGRFRRTLQQVKRLLRTDSHQFRMALRFLPFRYRKWFEEW